MKQFLLGAVLAALAYLAPIKEAVAAVYFFAAVDIALGVWASKREGQAITSDRLKRKPVDVIVYTVGMVCALVLQKHVAPTLPCVSLVALSVSAVELKSVDEKCLRLTGFSVLKSLAQRLSPTQGPPEGR